MPYDLAAITRRKRNVRRQSITLRPITPTGIQATNLYRAAYHPFVETWAGSLDRILAEYNRTLSALQTDSAADIGNILTEVDGLITRLLLQVRPVLSATLNAFQLWHQTQWKRSVLAGAGVDIGMLIGPEAARETVGQAIERNVALIRSVSDDARKRISDVVFNGLQQRTPVEQVALSLREAVDMPRARARRIASDQIVKLSSALDRERQREAGLDVWMWKHSAKMHPRKWHLERDGKIYSASEARVGTEIDGKTVREEPAGDDMPGIPPFCGCRTQAVLTFI